MMLPGTHRKSRGHVGTGDRRSHRYPTSFSPRQTLARVWHKALSPSWRDGATCVWCSHLWPHPRGRSLALQTRSASVAHSGRLPPVDRFSSPPRSLASRFFSPGIDRHRRARMLRRRNSRLLRPPWRRPRDCSDLPYTLPAPHPLARLSCGDAALDVGSSMTSIRARATAVWPTAMVPATGSASNSQSSAA